MKEFMLLIHNDGDQKSGMSPITQVKFLKECETYIEKLKAEGKLVAAQPLAREGVIISGTKSSLKETPFNEHMDIQVGYYHIRAKNIEDAIKIAKANPEFGYSAHAKIEVRPIKMIEAETGYVYPEKV